LNNAIAHLVTKKKKHHQTKKILRFPPTKVAGINKREARGIGIAVDHRRKNRSEQSLQDNVQRLKQYRARLILFPKRKVSSLHKRKPNEGKAEELAKAVQLTRPILPVRKKKIKPQARPVDADAAQRSAYVTLRRARADARLIGVRKARAAKAEEKAKLAKKE
jgi:large subunit ribosomal protein L13e